MEIIDELEAKRERETSLTVLEALFLRKLKLQQVWWINSFTCEFFLKAHFFEHRHLHNISNPRLQLAPPRVLIPLHPATRIPPPDPAVLDALYSVRSTPYANSFLSRLNGFVDFPLVVIAVDWEARTPWMNLMEDIKMHRTLKCPDEEFPFEFPAPIAYVTLTEAHLPQIHDLLRRTFWDGVDGIFLWRLS